MHHNHINNFEWVNVSLKYFWRPLHLTTASLHGEAFLCMAETKHHQFHSNHFHSNTTWSEKNNLQVIPFLPNLSIHSFLISTLTSPITFSKKRQKPAIRLSFFFEHIFFDRHVCFLFPSRTPDAFQKRQKSTEILLPKAYQFYSTLSYF